MPRLVVVKDERPVYVHEVARPTNVGRGSNNDLVLAEATVSWHHAVVWSEGERLWVRDLGSSNGTFVNERRIAGAEPIRPGDRLRFGPSCIVLVEGESLAAPVERGILVENVDAGVRVPIHSDRFEIGSAEGVDLRLDGMSAVAATLMVHRNGEVWLGLGEEDVMLRAGEPFEVEGKSFLLLEVGGQHVPTAVTVADRYPYKVDVELEGPTGPHATITDLATSNTYRVDAGNRAVLLWILAKKWAEDTANTALASDAGWCTNEEVQSGIWGKQGDDNKMHVLIYRLRGELKKAGFDPWFLEKRQRHVRIRIVEAQVR